jgi:hypothetical protein
MEPLQALLTSVMDAVSNDPKPDWRQSLIDGFDAVEAERDDLLAALEDALLEYTHRVGQFEAADNPTVEKMRAAIAKAKGGANMNNPTPGPWTENSCEIQAVDGSPICEMLARPEDSGVNYPHRPIADANSRLICAAPDLLAALQRFYDYMAFCSDNSEAEDDLVEMAREAIAKAKGGE